MDQNEAVRFMDMYVLVLRSAAMEITLAYRWIGLSRYESGILRNTHLLAWFALNSSAPG